MYSSQICDAALRQLSRRRSQALATADARRDELFTRVPRLKEIDNQLSLQGAQLAQIALSGENSSQQLHCIRQQNLALQQEQNEILHQLGLPENYLDPPYFCPV